MLAEIPAYRDENVEQLNSVLVIRNGELVYEHYFDAVTEDTVDQVWSVTKSVTSALIGIALDDGLIESVNQPIGGFFSADQLADSDPRLAEITVHELLTMTSGSWCGNDGCHDDAIGDVLDRELRNEPGETFVYDTGASHLLSGVLTHVTGMSESAYAEQELFAPLNIETSEWATDSDGDNFGGKGLQLRPRDMAKFGQLFLDQGVWQGEQLISAEFVQQATTSQVETGEASGYGYLWWLGEVEGYASYAAVGFGGQFVHVVPELELVTVLTSNYWPPRDNSSEIIEALIVPAVTVP